jgi:hypothetical protein
MYYSEIDGEWIMCYLAVHYHTFRATQMPTNRNHSVVKNARTIKGLREFSRPEKVSMMPRDKPAMPKISPTQPSQRGYTELKVIAIPSKA